MFGASEVQMIGRYFGNNAVYNAAAATSRAVFHLASELDAACETGARAQQQHQHQAAAAAHRAEALKQQQQQQHARVASVSDDDLVQVLFAKVDKKKARH